MAEGRTQEAWEAAGMVRRTIMLPTALERALAEEAQRRGIGAGELIRELIEQGLARGRSEEPPPSRP